ncbi:MAG TPA: hypothetical protein DDW84_00170 [Phycisphaerales bacterium]|nr:MAG: hypothetical protein A2Y13_01985 [Planctomycetes bacterium GWC2_45_44]HBG77252.1 hypothetical protein [Phycisphaerales bacterium]HBR19191.1 hypothetical protein [Phycisphaerales bacterium]
MADLKSFTVNGRTYRIDSIPPDDVLSLGIKISKLLAPMAGGLQGFDIGGKNTEDKIFSLIASASAGLDSDMAEKVLKECLSYVITPEMTYLRDASVRNAWFMKHPEDIMLVPIRATVEIAKDFLLPMLGTLGRNLKMTASASA